MNVFTKHSLISCFPTIFALVIQYLLVVDIVLQVDLSLTLTEVLLLPKPSQLLHVVWNVNPSFQCQNPVLYKPTIHRYHLPIVILR